MEFKDITGKRFGKLIAIKIVGKTKHRNTIWECRCDCGNIKNIARYNLGRNSISCGCDKDENVDEYTLIKPSLTVVYMRYKSGAKERGYVFGLSKEELYKITSSNCYYCGIEPNQIASRKNCRGIYRYNGIDRIDNDKGYVIDNVVPCCKTCNIAKRDMSKEAFLAWIKRAYNHNYGGK